MAFVPAQISYPVECGHNLNFIMRFTDLYVCVRVFVNLLKS